MKTEFIIQDINFRRDSAMDGEVNELETWSDLYRIREAANEAMDAIRESALSTLERIGGKCEDFGYRFEITQSGRYNYAEISEWKELNQRIKEVEQRAQMAYKHAIKYSAIMVTSDGEEVQAAQYIPSNPSIKIQRLK